MLLLLLMSNITHIVILYYPRFLLIFRQQEKALQLNQIEKQLSTLIL